MIVKTSASTNWLHLMLGHIIKQRRKINFKRIEMKWQTKSNEDQMENVLWQKMELNANSIRLEMLSHDDFHLQ